MHAFNFQHFILNVLLVNLLFIKCIVSHSLLSENFKLDKFSSLLQFLTSCTTHVTRDLNQLQYIHHNIDHICKGTCVKLQSARVMQSSNVGNSQNPFKLIIPIITSNLSMIQQDRYASKFRDVCYIEIIITKLMEDSKIGVKSLGLNFEHSQRPLKQNYKIFQPNYIFIPVRMNLINLKSVWLKVNVFSRAKIFFLGYKNLDILYVCVLCADVFGTEYVNDCYVLTLKAPVFNLKKEKNSSNYTIRKLQISIQCSQ